MTPELQSALALFGYCIGAGLVIGFLVSLYNSWTP